MANFVQFFVAVSDVEDLVHATLAKFIEMAMMQDAAGMSIAVWRRA